MLLLGFDYGRAGTGGMGSGVIEAVIQLEFSRWMKKQDRRLKLNRQSASQSSYASVCFYSNRLNIFAVYDQR